MSGTTNKKEEETAVATVGVTEEATDVLGTRSRTRSESGGGIDLLEALQLHNTTRQGVTQVPGLVRLKPAYYLQGECRLQIVLSFLTVSWIESFLWFQRLFVNMFCIDYDLYISFTVNCNL